MELVTRFVEYGQKLAESGFFDAFASRPYEDRVEALIESGKKRIVLDMPFYADEGPVYASITDGEGKRALVLSGMTADSLMGIVAKNLSCGTKELPRSLRSSAHVANLPVKVINASLYPIGVSSSGLVMADFQGKTYIVQDEVMPTLKLYEELFDMNEDWKIACTMPKLFQSLTPPMLKTFDQFMSHETFDSIPKKVEGLFQSKKPVNQSILPKGLAFVEVADKIYSATDLTQRNAELNRVFQATVPGYVTESEDATFEIAIVSATKEADDTYSASLVFKTRLGLDAMGSTVFSAEKLSESKFTKFLRQSGVTDDVVTEQAVVKALYSSMGELGFKQVDNLEGADKIDTAGLVKSAVQYKAVDITGDNVLYQQVNSSETRSIKDVELFRTHEIPEDLHNFREYAIVSM